jgi:hypothetical protein
VGDSTLSSIQVDTITARGGTGTITVPTGNRLVGTDVGSIVTSKGIVQLQYNTAMPTSHISTTVATEQSVPLISPITPKFSNSVIKVEFFSTMCSGSANVLLTLLYRRINGGAWTVLTPYTNTASRYTYGWNYNQATWQPYRNVYFDSPATTGLVEYVVNYRLQTAGAVAYLVHQYMEYGYILAELRQ